MGIRPSGRLLAGLLVLSVVSMTGLAPGVVRAQTRSRLGEAGQGTVVRVDVVVRDADGRPVRGLTQDDFDVFVAGRRQPIQAFAERAPVATGAVPRIRALPPDARWDVASNDVVTERHVVVLVVDDRDPSGTPSGVLLAARSFVEDLPAAAVVGIVFMSGRAGVELTHDRWLVRDVLTDPLTWPALADRPGARAAGAGDAGWSVGATLASAAARMPGENRGRRAFVLIGTAPPPSLDATAAVRLRDALSAGGVSMYAIQPGAAPDAWRADAWTDLIRRSGGRAFAGDEEAGQAALVVTEDIDYGYLLAYSRRTAVTEERLAVEVRRPGLDMRYRLGSGESVPAVAVEGQSDAPGVVPQSEAGLRLFAAAFPPSGREVPVAIAFEMTVPRAPLEDADPLLRDEVEFVVRALDLNTRQVVERRRKEDAVALRPRYGASLTADKVTYEFVTWVDLPPGRYQVALTARSVTLDARGSAYVTLDVPARSAGVPAVGGLVLGFPLGTNVPSALGSGADPVARDLRPVFGGIAGSTGVVARPPSLPRLRIDPTVQRQFESWDQVKVFFEVGLDGVADEAAAVIELLDASGQLVARESARATRRDDGRVTVDLPIANLAPGPYRVRARVTAGGREATRELGIAINGFPLAPGATRPGARTPVPTVPPVVPSVGPLPPPPAPPAVSASTSTSTPGAETSAGARAVESLRLRPDRSVLDEPALDLGTADQLASEGWDLYGKGDVEGAQVKLAAAVDAGSQSVWIHYARGLAEYALGHFAVAAESWEFVRRHEPTHEPVYFDLTDAYLSLDRPADAQAVLEDAARRWPLDPETHNALGVVLFSRGRVDEAIATFQRAVEVAPEDGLSHFNLGRAYHGRMLRWQASRTIQTASATSALADRDRQSAIREYQRALALGGSFEWDARDALRLLGG